MDGIRVLGGARIAAGLGILCAPQVAGRLFAGKAGTTPAVSIFARGFAARDVAIGCGILVNADRPEGRRPWLTAAAAADLADAAAVALVFERLPARERWIALGVSLAPAALELVALGAGRGRAMEPAGS